MKLLALVALALGLAAGDAGPTAEISMPGRFYAPNRLDALVGTTVTWRNTDAVSHTVTADNGSFDSGFLLPGATFSREFSQPGVYKLHCTIHRFMRGAVRVYALVLTGPDRPLTAGARVLFAGLAPAEATDVVLERATGTGWQTVDRRPPAADGRYAFTAIASQPALYRARAGNRTSPRVRVHVAPVVRARVVGQTMRVATSPARPSARAVLQTYDRERFGFVSGPRTRLGANGAGRLRLPPAPRAHVRVLVRGNGGWSDGTSQVFAVGSPPHR